jgi:hypothetical protein
LTALWFSGDEMRARTGHGVAPLRGAGFELRVDGIDCYYARQWASHLLRSVPAVPRGGDPDAAARSHLYSASTSVTMQLLIAFIKIGTVATAQFTVFWSDR